MEDDYRRKLLLLSMDRDKLCDPKEIPDQLWSNDVSLWPELEFGQIYTYLIETPGEYTREKMKSLDAYNYYIRYYNRYINFD